MHLNCANPPEIPCHRCVTQPALMNTRPSVPAAGDLPRRAPVKMCVDAHSERWRWLTFPTLLSFFPFRLSFLAGWQPACVGKITKSLALWTEGRSAW